MRRFITVLTLCLPAFTAQAALLGRAPLTPNGNEYQAYYDDVLDITWLADAGLAQTSGYDADGRMTWDAARDWIASLNAQNAGLGYLGANGWRLPRVTDTGSPGCDAAFTGTDCGYNVDLATGEMAHMYYSTLGNTPNLDTSGTPTGCTAALNGCLTNVGPFSNLQPFAYWSGTEYVQFSNTRAWFNSFQTGLQSTEAKVGELRAWAVHTGDIGLVVPVPGALWLFGSALGVMRWVRRKNSS